jgi:hypothetical protein
MFPKTAAGRQVILFNCSFDHNYNSFVSTEPQAVVYLTLAHTSKLEGCHFTSFAPDSFAVRSDDGVVVVVGCTFDGPGFFGESASISNSTFLVNLAPQSTKSASLMVIGALNVSSSSFSDSASGAIVLQPRSSFSNFQAVVSKCVFKNNSAPLGGAILLTVCPLVLSCFRELRTKRDLLLLSQV